MVEIRTHYSISGNTAYQRTRERNVPLRREGRPSHSGDDELDTWSRAGCACDDDDNRQQERS